VPQAATSFEEEVKTMSIFMVKSLLATSALLLAIMQTFTGLRTRGYFRRIPLPARTFRLWHRVGGDVTLALTTLVAMLCVYYAGIAFSPPRVPAHTALGTLAGLSMVAKVAIARKYRRRIRYSLKIGAVGGFSVLGTFILSALWYFLVVL
jgi:hypothetical protein